MSDSRFDTGTVVATLLGILCLVLAPRDALAEVQAPGERRDHLTVEELAPDARVNFGLVHNAYFMPVGPSADALHPLSGVLEVPETLSHSVRGRFPAFAVAFFTHGGHLVPAERDFIPGRASLWNLVLSPGRVWSEPGDDGWSRASFPAAGPAPSPMRRRRPCGPFGSSGVSRSTTSRCCERRFASSREPPGSSGGGRVADPVAVLGGRDRHVDDEAIGLGFEGLSQLAEVGVLRHLRGNRHLVMRRSPRSRPAAR